MALPRRPTGFDARAVWRAARQTGPGTFPEPVDPIVAMISLRPAAERGDTNYGWLDAPQGGEVLFFDLA
jgi:hypothetical protein